MQDRYLRTGIFLAPFHALGENPTLAIERDMELVEHLDRLNYHEAWIGEHHSGGFEIIACPEMFLAAAAQRTRNIRLGTGVVSLPYHHPFTLASRMMQLDHMARGRAITEASGRITPETARAVAETGVDQIAVGWITHSARVLDIGLDT